MEQNFQTSFIPKQSIVKERVISTQSVSLVTIISLFIFLAVLVGTGGLYFYKISLKKNVDEMKNNLSLAQNRFEPSIITSLSALDRRLTASSEILSKHVAVTPIFEALQALTMKTVRFTSFNYTVPADAKNSVLVKLKGIAIGYRSVALQADLFSQNKNFMDPIFSNLQLDDKGNVTFEANFSVDQSLVNYKQSLLTEGADNQ